jgi:predicted DNA-binding transcriptional regulator AlpA
METHGDTTMQKLVTFKNLLLILGVSEPTGRRYIAEDDFPKSVSGSGKKLLFRAEDIEAWMARHQRSQPVQIESSVAQRSKRHAAAMKRLESKGVRVANSKPLDTEET